MVLCNIRYWVWGITKRFELNMSQVRCQADHCNCVCMYICMYVCMYVCMLYVPSLLNPKLEHISPACVVEKSFAHNPCHFSLRQTSSLPSLSLSPPFKRISPF